MELSKSGLLDLNSENRALKKRSAHAGRLCDAVTDKVVEKVEILIMTDRRLTVNAIAREIGTSSERVHRIIHEKNGDKSFGALGAKAPLRLF